MKHLYLLTLIFLMGLTFSFNMYSYGTATSSSGQDTGLINISNWNQVFQWDVNRAYIVDDIVRYNQIHYIALKDHTNKTPGEDGSQSFWEII